MLAAVVFCAGKEYRRSPALAICAMAIATAARAPTHSQQLAELVGVGRGVDLILYCISLLLLLDPRTYNQPELHDASHDKAANRRALLKSPVGAPAYQKAVFS